MEENTTAVETPTDATDEEVSAKDFVIDKISEEITAFTGQKKGAKTLAKRLLLVVTESMFQAVANDGYLRFSGGFGALKVKTIAATVRRVPATGESVNCPARKKIVLVEGKTAKALVNNTTPA